MLCICKRTFIPACIISVRVWVMVWFKVRVRVMVMARFRARVRVSMDKIT